MTTTANVAGLTECVRSLDDEDRRALRRYWEQVIREEWVPPAARREPLPASVPADGRRRREARRAMARIAAAGRVAPVVSLPTSTPAVAGSGVAA